MVFFSFPFRQPKEAIDVAPSYINVGQLVEMRISFRCYRSGHKRIFKTKLNSVLVYSSSASRVNFSFSVFA